MAGNAETRQSEMHESDLDRERQLARAFVRLADTLVQGFDIVELFDDLVSTCVRLLGLAAAGLVLADQRGALRPMAASSEETRLLELLELQNDEGPCLDSYKSSARVVVEGTDVQVARWPSFAAQAGRLGFGPVYALPMHLREQTIGALNLFGHPHTRLSEAQLDIGQAMADVATIAIIEHRARLAERQLAEQLQTALNSRIAIEQAKGVVAAHANVDMPTAFALLRNYARNHNAELSDVALRVGSGQLPPARIIAGRPTAGGPGNDLGNPPS